MRRTPVFVGFTAILAIATLGCQSHQAKVDALQKKYDQLGKQFRQDCSSEMLNVPPKLSPKCSEESKRVGEAWNRLLAERAKK
jgi:hypothetical protein